MKKTLTILVSFVMIAGLNSCSIENENTLPRLEPSVDMQNQALYELIDFINDYVEEVAGEEVQTRALGNDVSVMTYTCAYSILVGYQELWMDPVNSKFAGYNAGVWATFETAEQPGHNYSYRSGGTSANGLKPASQFVPLYYTAPAVGTPDYFKNWGNDYLAHTTVVNWLAPLYGMTPSEMFNSGSVEVTVLPSGGGAEWLLANREMFYGIMDRIKAFLAYAGYSPMYFMYDFINDYPAAAAQAELVNAYLFGLGRLSPTKNNINDTLTDYAIRISAETTAKLGTIGQTNHDMIQGIIAMTHATLATWELNIPAN